MEIQKRKSVQVNRSSNSHYFLLILSPSLTIHVKTRPFLTLYIMLTERNKLSMIKICHFRKTFWKAVLQPLVTPTRGLDVDSSAVNVFHHTQVLVLEWLILIQGWNVFSDVWAQRPSTLFLQHTAWTGTEVMRSSNRAAERLCPDAVAPGEVWKKIGFPDIYV